MLKQVMPKDEWHTLHIEILQLGYADIIVMDLMSSKIVDKV